MSTAQHVHFAKGAKTHPTKELAKPSQTKCLRTDSDHNLQVIVDPRKRTNPAQGDVDNHRKQRHGHVSFGGLDIHPGPARNHNLLY